MSTSTAPAHLRVDGISLSYGDRRVLTDVSFTVSATGPVGVIGENGSGKSTLLRIIAGLLPPDAGTVTATAPGGAARIGLLHQEPPFRPHATVEEALEDAVAPIRAAAADLDRAADRLAAAPDDESSAHAYAHALETAEQAEVWTLDARIAAMLDGLGLTDIPRGRRTGDLSGGERARLSLAGLLLSRPDILLLDEPTNHLDDAATAYLRDALTAWTGPVLLATHDRAFLDESVTALVDLDPAALPHAVSARHGGDDPGSGFGVTRFSGTYTDYLAARECARRRWEQQYEDEQAELGRLAASGRQNQTFGNPARGPRTEARAAKKFYADRNAKVVSRRVNDARGRYEELQAAQVRRPPKELQFTGLTSALPDEHAPREGVAGRASATLTASGVSVHGRLAPISLTVGPGEKWLITGPNGAGKSTLLALLAGVLHADTGSVSRPRTLRVGLLHQDVELPDPHSRGADRTVRQAYEDIVGSHRAAEIPLSTFGLIAPRDETRMVDALSVGQRRRLALATLLADPPDVLLLDEPTNHLSLPLATHLEAAIPHYPGAVVVASHDRWLRRSWHGETLAIPGSGAPMT
ncbi:MAG: ABC-F family ATP-binding cassette domain-containing protein [Mobilicoccus sp.]|nr:ABC-F family ATP-binding cassette domain-containing protein [Mobilicoccus sp.]